MRTERSPTRPYSCAGLPAYRRVGMGNEGLRHAILSPVSRPWSDPPREECVPDVQARSVRSAADRVQCWHADRPWSRERLGYLVSGISVLELEEYDLPKDRDRSATSCQVPMTSNNRPLPDLSTEHRGSLALSIYCGSWAVASAIVGAIESACHDAHRDTTSEESTHAPHHLGGWANDNSQRRAFAKREPFGLYGEGVGR